MGQDWARSSLTTAGVSQLGCDGSRGEELVLDAREVAGSWPGKVHSVMDGGAGPWPSSQP